MEYGNAASDGGEVSTVIGSAAARKLAETRARCADQRARTEEILKRAETALAKARDRLRRAHAAQDAVNVARKHAVPPASGAGHPARPRPTTQVTERQ